MAYVSTSPVIDVLCTETWAGNRRLSMSSSLCINDATSLTLSQDSVSNGGFVGLVTNG